MRLAPARLLLLSQEGLRVVEVREREIRQTDHALDRVPASVTLKSP